MDVSNLVDFQLCRTTKVHIESNFEGNVKICWNQEAGGMLTEEVIGNMYNVDRKNYSFPVFECGLLRKSSLCEF